MDAERGRRHADLSALVRRWVAEGDVRTDVATRFLLVLERETRRLRAAWLAAGAPRRRREDA